MYMYVYYIPSYLRYVYAKLHYVPQGVHVYFVHCHLRVFTLAFIALHIHRLAHPVFPTTVQVHVDPHGV